jgi:hypothetical protein
MKSTVFSVLKIVAIAMLVVWALQPAAVQASGPYTCNLQAESYCTAAMTQCCNNCGYNNPNCIVACEQVLFPCLEACGCMP